MKFIKIAFNEKYLKGIGVPQEYYQEILNKLSALPKKLKKKFINDIKKISLSGFDINQIRNLSYDVQENIYEKIKDPYVKLFVNKYGNTYDLKQFKYENQIQQFIATKLLPELEKKINPDSENNYYLKNVDVKEIINDPNIPDHLRQQLSGLDPEEIKEKYFEFYNGQKEENFKGWWEEIYGNEFYDNPAFQFVILDRVFKTSNGDVKNPVKPINAEVVSDIYSLIEQSRGEDFDINKKYKEIELNKEEKSGNIERVGDGDQWIRIKSSKNDPNNFSENIQRLASYSCDMGWCIANESMAKQYLGEGDVYIYLKDGVTSVGLALNSDNSIKEIQGRNNQRPFESWEDIVNFVDQKGFGKESAHYRELEKAKTINERLDNDPNYIEEFKNKFDNDPRIFNMLSKERQSKPEFLDIAVKYWTAQISNASDSLHYGGKLNAFSRCPSLIKDKLDKSIVDLVYSNVIKALNDLNHYNLEAIMKHNLLDYYDYAEKFAKFISPIIKENPWVISILNDNIKEKIDPDLLELAKSSYSNMLIEELTVPSKLNPEEIIENYYGDIDGFVGIDQEEINSMFGSDDDLDKPLHSDDFNKSLHNVAFISYLLSKIPDFWAKYISKDPINLYEELEDYLHQNERYDNIDEFDECQRMLDDAWYNKILENPKEIHYVPGNARVSYRGDWDNDDDDWYIVAWSKYALENLDEFSDAQEYLNNIDLEIYYRQVLSSENFEIIKKEIKTDFDFLSENYEIFRDNSSFIEGEDKFIKEEINRSLNDNENSINGLLSIIEDIESDYDFFEESEMDRYNNLYRNYKLSELKERPYIYKDLPREYQADEEFIDAWQGNIPAWIDLLWKYDDQILSKAPKQVLNNSDFSKELKKINIIKGLKITNVQNLLNFENIIEPYKNDNEFYEKALNTAKQSYSRFIRMSLNKSIGDTQKMSEAFGKVPTFFSKQNLEYISESIVSSLFAYRNKLMGKELSVIDDILVDFILPKMKAYIDVKIYSLKDLLLLINFMSEACIISPNLFQDIYQNLKESFLYYLRLDPVYSMNLFPNLFKTDNEVLSAVRGIMSNRKDFLSDKIQNDFINNIDENNEESEPVLSSNWYKSYKKIKLSQKINNDVKIIEPYEVLDIIERFGTKRFTIGFRKKDGSFRTMNAQSHVQRPYEKEQKEYVPQQREYMTLYDLQIASQVAREAFTGIDVNTIDSSVLRKAYRRVYPHTVEFIKGEGEFYVVKNTPYAIEHGFEAEYED